MRVNGADDRRARASREDRAEGDLALGVRPEHIRFDDASQLRGRSFGAEYLGTTQIVTVNTAHGQVKARLPADIAVAHRRDRRPDRSAPSACRCSTRPPAARIRTALDEEPRHG